MISKRACLTHRYRDSEHPFSNLGSFEGIAPDHLEEMEQRLKEDLIRECTLYGGKILVHDETDLQQARMAIILNSYIINHNL